MTSRKSLESTVDRFMEAEMDRLFAAVPSARHLAEDGVELDELYYLRHRIETVKRIWLTSRTDALALAEMVREDYEAARWWSKYTWQELSHDTLYLRDLEKHGYTLERVTEVPPFAATLGMVDYIERRIATAGSIAAVSYSVWVEWNSDRTASRVVDKVSARYGPEFTKGARAHVGIDVNEDHYQIMLDVSDRLTARTGNRLVLFEILRDLTDFVAQYFQELEESIALLPAAARA